MWDAQELEAAKCKVHQEGKLDGQGETEVNLVVGELVSILGSKYGR